MNKKQCVTRKVTINVPVVLFEELKARCESYGTNITTEILNCVRQGLQQEKAMEYLPQVLKELAEMKNNKSKIKQKLSNTKLKVPKK